jgi:hypothetical protein
MATPTGQANAFEGSSANYKSWADNSLVPFCNNPKTPRVDAVELLVLFSTGIFFQATIPNMPAGCKRPDETACDVTDYAGCFNIPGGPVHGQSYDICGPWGMTLPKTDAMAAMAAIYNGCNVNGNVGGDVQFSSGITIRL